MEHEADAGSCDEPPTLSAKICRNITKKTQHIRNGHINDSPLVVAKAPHA
jgi:hypothetical protein